MATADPTADHGGVLLDARGYPRGPAIQPGHGAGRPPANKGREYPPDLPTVDEIVAVCRQCPDSPAGRRARALIVLLWRSAVRVGCEALRLTEHDLDPARGAIVIRKGKGGKRRTVGMDPWAWEEITPWLQERQRFPIGPLFCVVEGPTAGRGWDAVDVRKTFHRLAREAGVRRRFAPHQLRHAWTVEALREGVPLHIIMRQLGHANLAITTKYIEGITADEVVNAVFQRPQPVIPISHALAA